MKKQLPLTIKIQSLLLVICFAATNLLNQPAFAQKAGTVHKRQKEIQEPSLILSHLQIPEQIGKIQEVYKASNEQRATSPEKQNSSSRPLVILIQDAHAIPEAQRNIQKIIEHFQKQYGVGLVAVEGASSKLDSQIFQSFPDKERLKKTMEEYFEKGEITGSVAAAIFSPHPTPLPQGEGRVRETVFHGIEDWSLYEEGIGLYLEAMEVGARLIAPLQSEQNRLEAEKQRSYSKELFEIDQALKEFRENHTDLIRILKILAEVRKPETVGARLPRPSSKGEETSPLQVLLEEIREDKGRDESIEKEVKGIARFFNRRGAIHGAQSGTGVINHAPTDEVNLRQFNQKYQAFQTSQISAGEFGLYLKELIERLSETAKRRTGETGKSPIRPFSDSPIHISKTLMSLIAHQQRLRELEGPKFFKEFEAYTHLVKESLFRNETERKLDQESHKLELLTKLAKLELSREEWEELKGGMGETAKRREEFSFKWKSHLRFYKNAEHRDEAFFRNLQKLFSHSPIHRFSDSAILVAGGFHTEGLIKRFKEQGISYVLVTPQMTNVPTQTNYRQHMRGEVSWKDYFQIENGRAAVVADGRAAVPGGGKINLYKAFVRGTRDKLLREALSVKGEASASRDTFHDSRLLKAWRDQIIRDLAEKEQISKAQQYTQFLDEIVRDGSQQSGTVLWTKGQREPSLIARTVPGDLRTKWLANIDRFIDGLGKLKSTQALNEQTLRQLFKPATILSAAAGNANLSFSTEIKVDLMPGISRSEMRTKELGQGVFDLKGFDIPVWATDMIELNREEARIFYAMATGDLEIFFGEPIKDSVNQEDISRFFNQFPPNLSARRIQGLFDYYRQDKEHHAGFIEEWQKFKKSGKWEKLSEESKKDSQKQFQKYIQAFYSLQNKIFYTRGLQPLVTLHTIAPKQEEGKNVFVVPVDKVFRIYVGPQGLHSDKSFIFKIEGDELRPVTRLGDKLPATLPFEMGGELAVDAGHMQIKLGGSVKQDSHGILSVHRILKKGQDSIAIVNHGSRYPIFIARIVKPVLPPRSELRSVDAYRDFYDQIRENNSRLTEIREEQLTRSHLFLTSEGRLKPLAERKGETFGITEVSFLPPSETRKKMAAFQQELKKQFGQKVYLTDEELLHFTTQGLELQWEDKSKGITKPLTTHEGLDKINVNAEPLAGLLKRAREIETLSVNMQVARLNWDPAIGIFWELRPYLSDSNQDPIMERRKTWDLPQPRPPHITGAYFTQPFSSEDLRHLRELITKYNQRGPEDFGDIDVNSVDMIAYTDLSFNDGIRTLATIPFANRAEVRSSASRSELRIGGMNPDSYPIRIEGKKVMIDDKDLETLWYHLDSFYIDNRRRRVSEEDFKDYFLYAVSAHGRKAQRVPYYLVKDLPDINQYEFYWSGFHRAMKSSDPVFGPMYLAFKNNWLDAIIIYDYPDFKQQGKPIVQIHFSAYKKLAEGFPSLKGEAGEAIPMSEIVLPALKDLSEPEARNDAPEKKIPDSTPANEPAPISLPLESPALPALNKEPQILIRPENFLMNFIRGIRSKDQKLTITRDGTYQLDKGEFQAISANSPLLKALELFFKDIPQINALVIEPGLRKNVLKKAIQMIFESPSDYENKYFDIQNDQGSVMIRPRYLEIQSPYELVFTKSGFEEFRNKSRSYEVNFATKLKRVMEQGGGKPKKAQLHPLFDIPVGKSSPREKGRLRIFYFIRDNKFTIVGVRSKVSPTDVERQSDLEVIAKDIKEGRFGSYLLADRKEVDQFLLEKLHIRRSEVRSDDAEKINRRSVLISLMGGVIGAVAGALIPSSRDTYFWVSHEETTPEAREGIQNLSRLGGYYWVTLGAAHKTGKFYVTLKKAKRDIQKEMLRGSHLFFGRKPTMQGHGEKALIGNIPIDELRTAPWGSLSIAQFKTNDGYRIPIEIEASTPGSLVVIDLDSHLTLEMEASRLKNAALYGFLGLLLAPLLGWIKAPYRLSFAPLAYEQLSKTKFPAWKVYLQSTGRSILELMLLSKKIWFAMFFIAWVIAFYRLPNYLLNKGERIGPFENILTLSFWDMLPWMGWFLFTFISAGGISSTGFFIYKSFWRYLFDQKFEVFKEGLHFRFGELTDIIRKFDDLKEGRAPVSNKIRSIAKEYFPWRSEDIQNTKKKAIDLIESYTGVLFGLRDLTEQLKIQVSEEERHAYYKWLASFIENFDGDFVFIDHVIGIAKAHEKDWSVTWFNRRYLSLADDLLHLGEYLSELEKTLDTLRDETSRSEVRSEEKKIEGQSLTLDSRRVTRLVRSGSARLTTSFSDRTSNSKVPKRSLTSIISSRKGITTSDTARNSPRRLSTNAATSPELYLSSIQSPLNAKKSRENRVHRLDSTVTNRSPNWLISFFNSWRVSFNSWRVSFTSSLTSFTSPRTSFNSSLTSLMSLFNLETASSNRETLSLITRVVSSTISSLLELPWTSTSTLSSLLSNPVWPSAIIFTLLWISSSIVPTSVVVYPVFLLPLTIFSFFMTKLLSSDSSRNGSGILGLKSPIVNMNNTKFYYNNKSNIYSDAAPAGKGAERDKYQKGRQADSRSEVRSVLKERYEKLYQDFMAVEVKADSNSTAYVFDPKKLEAMRSNFEQDEKGDLRKDLQGEFIPRTSEVYPLYIPINTDEKVSLYLQQAVKEILQSLPEGTQHYAAPPPTYHISTFMAQDLRPEDVAGPNAAQLVLTAEERTRLTQMMHEELKMIPGYSIRLSGIRFSPQDGGVIAVFEDHGETDQIRARLTQRGHEVTAKIDKTKYPKNFIHVTLFRILENIDAATLEKLKELAQKYHDLSSLELDHEVSEMEFAHETGWMHSQIEPSSKQTFTLASRSEVRITRAEAFRSKENFDWIAALRSFFEDGEAFFDQIKSGSKMGQGKFDQANIFFHLFNVFRKVFQFSQFILNSFEPLSKGSKLIFYVFEKNSPFSISGIFGAFVGNFAHFSISLYPQFLNNRGSTLPKSGKAVNINYSHNFMINSNVKTPTDSPMRRSEVRMTRAEAYRSKENFEAQVIQRSELRNSPQKPGQAPAKEFFENWVLEKGITLSEEEEQILTGVFQKNFWAIQQGRLDPEDILHSYSEGPYGALNLLRKKVSEGIRSWSELLMIVEMHPSLFERIYVDLDDTLFTPKGYVGSEQWLRDEMENYNKKTKSIRAEKWVEEKRLLEVGWFEAVEPELIERLNELKGKGIEVIGLTAREFLTREMTENILAQMGMKIPVIYTELANRKRSALQQALSRRDEAIKIENEKRLEKTRELMIEDRKKMSEEEFEEFVKENTSLLGRGKWLFVDDQRDRILGPQIVQYFVSQDLWAFRYDWRKIYELDAIIKDFQKALNQGLKEIAAAHAIDILMLMKLEEDENKRGEFYREIESFVKEQSNARLTMAYVESISDYLAKGMGQTREDRDSLLKSYFQLVTPHNWEMFVRAFEAGKISIRKVDETISGKHAEMNYEITMDERNIYFFLEPLLRYLRQASPEVLILPDTGARPFQKLMEEFIQKEGLQTKVVVFPISRNTASDTVYEIRRWLKLVTGEIKPTEVEKEFVNLLSQLGLDVLKAAKKVAVLDDNLTSGQTAAMLEEMLRAGGHLESFVVLSPYAYRSPEKYPFQVITTFRIYGDYAWRSSSGTSLSPPLSVLTAWEYDYAKRGAKSRSRFQYPPSPSVSPDEAFGTRLLESFLNDYNVDRQAISERAPPPIQTPVIPKESIVPPSLNLELHSQDSILPDLIHLNGIRLQRKRDILKDATWIHEQKALNQNDLQQLSLPDVLLYEILNERSERLGIVLLMLAKNEKGEKGLVIQKIQPKMETERQFDPRQIVEMIKEQMKSHQVTYGIHAIYMDTYEVTMTGLSESHWVRNLFNQDPYRYLPRAKGLLYLNGKTNDWIGEKNIVWKELSDEEKQILKEARERIGQILEALGKKVLRKILTTPEKERIKRIEQLLTLNLPITSEDVTFLKVSSWYLKHLQDQDIKALSREGVETIRTRLLYEMLIEENEGNETDLRFPEGYFNPKTEWQKEIRTTAALDYFLNHLWKKGSDLSRLNKSDLAQWGLLPVFKHFNYQKGKLLQYLDPGGYVFRPGEGYKPNVSEYVSEENFKRYLKGKWYAVAPGQKYKITGHEKNRKGNPSQFFENYAGIEIEFLEDQNHGTIGRIGNKEILYIENEKTTNLNKARAKRTLGWLDIVSWLEGKYVIPRSNEESSITGTVKRGGGQILIKSLSHLPYGGTLTVGAEFEGQKVIGILTQDINHGVLLEWYRFDESTAKPDKTILLNAHYFQEGQLKAIHRGNLLERDLGWLDIVAWMNGKKVIPRQGQKSSVIRTVGLQGRVVIKGDPNVPKAGYLSVGMRYQGMKVIGILREDINYGTVLEWYEFDDEKQAPKNDKVLNIHYFDKKQIRIAYEGGNVSSILGRLDVTEWMRGREITPRDNDASFVDGPVTETAGLLYVKHDLTLPWKGNISVGRKFAGKKTIGVLRRDINHGVMLQLYEEDEALKRPKNDELFNAYYFDKGVLKQLNEGRSSGRALGWLDIVKWLRKERISPRSNDQSRVIGIVTGDGKVNIKGGDSTLTQNGALVVGERFKGIKVIGILRNDINHGAHLEWYEYDEALKKPKEEKHLAIHYFENGKLQRTHKPSRIRKPRVLNLGKLNLGELDVVNWLARKNVIPREDDASAVIREVSPIGVVTVKKDLSLTRKGVLYVDQNYAGQKVIGILRKDINHGVVLEWYPILPETGKPNKEILLTANYFKDGKLIGLNKGNEEKRTLGWLDIVTWRNRNKVTPREEDKSFITGEVNVNGQVIISLDQTYGRPGLLNVGRQVIGKKVIGILKEDINYGNLLEWYERDQKTGKPIKEKLLNVHFFDEHGELKALNQGNVTPRNLGWLDMVAWMSGKKIRLRANDESSFVGTVGSNGHLSVKVDSHRPYQGSIPFGHAYKKEKVIGVLVEDYGEIQSWWFHYDEALKRKTGPLIKAFAIRAGELVDVTVPVRTRSEVRMTRAEAYRSKENFEAYMDQRILDLIQGYEKELAGYLQAWHKANSRNKQKEIEKEKIQPFLDRINARAFGVTSDQVQVVSEIPQLEPSRFTPEMRKQAFLDVIQGKIVSEFFFASDSRQFDQEWMYFLDMPKAAREANLVVPPGVNPRIQVPLGVRQLLAYRIRIERNAKKIGLNPEEALSGVKMLIHLHPENAEKVMTDIWQHDFYGFSPAHVYFLIQDSFQGRMPGGYLKWKVQKIKQSPLFTAGHGYATAQMTRPQTVFNLTPKGERVFLPSSFFEYLENGGAVMMVSHRDNDLTQITEEVLDLNRLSFMKELMGQGIQFVTEAVQNPNKQQGGNRVRAKGIIPGFSPEFLIEAIVSQTTEWKSLFDQQSVPYNTFRNGYLLKPVNQALIYGGLPGWLTFREGYLYLTSVTGDLTQNSHLRNQGYIKEGEMIHDIKTLGNLPEGLAFIAEQDRNPRFLELALQNGFRRAEIWNPEPIYELIEQLKDQDWHLREEAALRLAKAGAAAREAIPHLLYLLHEENESQHQVRQAVIDSLTQIAKHMNEAEISEIAGQLIQVLVNDELVASQDAMRGLVKIGGSAVPALRDALRDHESPEKRRLLIQTLGKIGAEAADAVIQLVALLDEQQPEEVSQEAKRTLIIIGNPASSYLMGILKDKEKSDYLRQAMAEILIKTGHSSRSGIKISKIVNDLRKDSSPAFSMFAQNALTKAGADDLFGLIQVAKDPHALPHTRALAARAIGDVASTLKRDSEGQMQVIRNLVELLTPPIDHEIYEASAEALGKVGPSALNDLRGLLNHDDVLLRAGAARALAVMGPQAQPILPDVFVAFNRTGNTYGTVRLFGKALSKIGPASIPGLLESLRSEVQEIRDVAAEALGEIARFSKIETETFNYILSQLLIAYGDARAAVFSSAYHSFILIGRPVLPRLIERMKNGSLVEKEGAVRVLGSMADQAEQFYYEIVPGLVEIYNQSSELELRLAALDALGHFVSKSDLQEMITNVVIPPLIAASQDQNPLTRKTAAQTIAYVRYPTQELIAAAIDNLANKETRDAYQKALIALRNSAFEAITQAASNDERESVRSAAQSVLNSLSLYEPIKEKDSPQNRSEVRMALALALYPQNPVQVTGRNALEILDYLAEVPVGTLKEALKRTVEEYTATLDVERFQQKVESLIDTLPADSKHGLTIGLVLPGQDKKFENQSFVERFLSVLQRINWVNQVIVAKGSKGNDQLYQAILGVGNRYQRKDIRIRAVDLERKLMDEDQIIVPVVFAHQAEQKQIHQMFSMITDDMSGDMDADTEAYGDVMKIVLAAHLADILNTQADLLKGDPLKIKAELLKRMRISDEFKDMITVIQGKNGRLGIQVRSVLAALHLRHQSHLKLQQAA